MTHILWLLLREHQPDTTEDESYRIALELGNKQLQGMLDLALGKLPEKPGAGLEGNAPAPAAQP